MPLNKNHTTLKQTNATDKQQHTTEKTNPTTEKTNPTTEKTIIPRRNKSYHGANIIPLTQNHTTEAKSYH